MRFQSTIMVIIGTMALMGCFSTSVMAIGDVKRTDPPQTVIGVKRQRSEDPLIEYRKPTDSLGFFRTEIVPVDILRKIFVLVDIRSLTRFERASKGIKDHVQANMNFQSDEGQTITWLMVKRIQIPHQEGIPWPLRYEGVHALVEACICFPPWKDGEDWEEGSEQATQGVKWLDKACALKDWSALWRKFRGLQYGLYGYQELLNEGSVVERTIIEDLVDQGNEDALELKIFGLSTGDFGYPNDPAAARQLNDQEILRGDKRAIKRKEMVLFGDGCELYHYGYTKDREALGLYYEELKSQTDQNATKRKLKGLRKGEYGYEIDLDAARQLNDELVRNGDEKAIQNKIKELSGLKYDYLDYPEDPDAAKKLNEDLVSKGDKAAIKRKVEGLYKGKYGYPRDPKYSRQLNEQLVLQGNKEAIQRKFVGLCTGWHGYSRDPKEARRLLKESFALIGRKLIQSDFYKHVAFEESLEEACEFSREWSLPLEESKPYELDSQ